MKTFISLIAIAFHVDTKNWRCNIWIFEVFVFGWSVIYCTSRISWYFPPVMLCPVSTKPDYMHFHIRYRRYPQHLYTRSLSKDYHWIQMTFVISFSWFVVMISIDSIFILTIFQIFSSSVRRKFQDSDIMIPKHFFIILAIWHWIQFWIKLWHYC